jgi:hypothetical protein
MVRIFCFTSDKTLSALRVFAHLLTKYWPMHPDVVVAGFSQPDFNLPPSFQFRSIGKFERYPIGEWSTAVIEFLYSMSDVHFIWMQEDLWLLRQVDRNAVTAMCQMMLRKPDIGRFDLCRDRANNADIQNAGYLGYLDLVESTPQIVYHFSFQSSIWRRDTMLACLAPHETPWQAEIAGNKRLADTGKRVLGTRQSPLKYLIAYQRGELTLDGGYQGKEYAMSQTDIGELQDLG